MTQYRRTANETATIINIEAFFWGFEFVLANGLHVMSGEDKSAYQHINVE